MNLLTDSLLRVQTDKGLQRINLPALMAALGCDEVHQLVGMQRHQEDAFHVFLCCLTGAILARRGDTDPAQSDDYWRDGLRALAEEAGDDAWTLVVDDLSRPAFMQPPLPKADQGKVEPKADTPDELDLLVTSKNHDIKQARASHAHTDEWIYALISLQTMSGYPGRDNPGISRMNGGFGNRPIVELVRSRSPGGRWRDAVLRLLHHRGKVLAGEYGYDPQGLVLVWVEPWDGQAGLPLSRLDPFYVEICRRVRLRGGDAITHAEAVPSKSNRIAAKQLNGVVGDAWLPVDVKGPDSERSPGVKALTVPPQGLTPEILRRLVFADELNLTALQRPLDAWKGEMWLVASVLVRGQGTTDGFYERHVRLPPPVQHRIFGPPSQRGPLAALSKSAIEYAGKMQQAVLKPAVFVYLEGSPGKLQFDRDSAQAWWIRFARRFDHLWSEDYFSWLWSVPDPFDEQTVLTDRANQLRDHALTVLHEVEQTIPAHTGRRYRTHTLAEDRFWGALYHKNNFPFLKENSHERVADV